MRSTAQQINIHKIWIALSVIETPEEAGWAFNLVGSSSCIQYHESHGLSYVSLLKNKYIKIDYNQWRDDDFALCWNCHVECDTVLGECI
jgi:hypothetical protein